MTLFQNHQQALNKAVAAISERTYYAAYPEHPKAYAEDAGEKGKAAFDAQLNKPFDGINSDQAEAWIGEEVSPYTNKPLGITYPSFTTDTLINNASKSWNDWRNTSILDRAGILVESLERIKDRFFEMAYATQHTTGQSFMMSFQASGPHANDRAMEAIALGYDELTRYPNQVQWTKPMGKFDIELQKNFKPIPKGISLCIGCSTFPTWNSVPGIYASLITGNPVIVKPHAGSVYPIAIVVAEIQKVLDENNLDVNIIQLAVDQSSHLIAKDLVEHDAVKIIDYTGGSAFGNYIESVENKTVFTEKAGVNSVILDSAHDLKSVMQNLAFSVSLYSGQMCTAPQNFFIPESGIRTDEGLVSYDEAVELLKNSIDGLVKHPKMGAGTLGAIQNENTLARSTQAKELGAKVILDGGSVENAEFESARVCSPTLLETDADQTEIYSRELFGPVALVVKTKDTDHSIELCKKLVSDEGAITCAAYTTDEGMRDKIETEMNAVFAPVSFNLTGFIWVNQHAAFSDFHVTGGNPAGNASFTNPEYINKRFVWVGNREIIN